MKKDIHIKVEQCYLNYLEDLAKKEGLPFVRLIETAIREYCETLKKYDLSRYRVTGFNTWTGRREVLSGLFRTATDAQIASVQYRDNIHIRLQVEKVTL